ncbi:MAG: hypothetical protein AAB353_01210 [Candidatus Hydrogenedentota bacterium]
MKKVVFVIIIVVVAFPFVPKLFPKSMTIERVTDAFEKAAYTITDLHPQDPPFREAEQQWDFTVDGGYKIEVYRYAKSAKLTKNLEYLKTDPGSAMVEASGLAQNLGARPSRDLPSAVGKKGKWMIHVRGEDRGQCGMLVKVFQDS